MKFFHVVLLYVRARTREYVCVSVCACVCVCVCIYMSTKLLHVVFLRRTSSMEDTLLEMPHLVCV